MRTKMEPTFISSKKKTNKYLVLPITNEALQLLGERKEPVERIFNFLRYSSQTSVCLSRWMLKAGITKKITFHAGRHTHATLLLSKGVDISTVSKLLGHRHLKSTERYSHITDNLKIEAINKLPILFEHKLQDCISDESK